MKPKLVIRAGRESSDDEINEVTSAFFDGFDVSCEKNIVRMSVVDLSFLIEFSVAAIGGGMYYDSLKLALMKLIDLFNSGKLKRNPKANIGFQSEKWQLDGKKIVLLNSDEKLEFVKIDDFIENLKKNSK